MSTAMPPRRTHRDVLIAPVVSEKSYGLLDENKYTFVVDPRANKTEIRHAVESIFDVRWSERLTWGDIYRQNEEEFSRFNFEEADVEQEAPVTEAPPPAEEPPAEEAPPAEPTTGIASAQCPPPFNAAAIPSMVSFASPKISEVLSW